MRSGLTTVLLLVVGVIWMGQGANPTAGSFMTGEIAWLVIRGGAALGDSVLMWWDSKA